MGRFFNYLRPSRSDRRANFGNFNNYSSFFSISKIICCEQVTSQKNRLNETVLLSTKTAFKPMGKEFHLSFYAQKICLSRLTRHLFWLCKVWGGGVGRGLLAKNRSR